ncbi:MAG: hypothetical protein EOP56_17660 [Sphingobacteriales bacterium]|nr:MAG: hypothetical protein EOP56_17660 [Sphingobacteriales bacterium]
MCKSTMPIAANFDVEISVSYPKVPFRTPPFRSHFTAAQHHHNNHVAAAQQQPNSSTATPLQQLYSTESNV